MLLNMQHRQLSNPRHHLITEMYFNKHFKISKIIRNKYNVYINLNKILYPKIKEIVFPLKNEVMLIPYQHDNIATLMKD